MVDTTLFGFWAHNQRNFDFKMLFSGKKLTALSIFALFVNRFS